MLLIYFDGYTLREQIKIANKLWIFHKRCMLSVPYRYEVVPYANDTPV